MEKSEGGRGVKYSEVEFEFKTNMKAKRFDQKFEAGKDIIGNLDMSKARRPATKLKKVNVEVSSISPHGLWLLVGGKELFMSHDKLPWFRSASRKKINNFKEINPGHLYWPNLDIDLPIEAIRHPERFPLVAQNPGFVMKSKTARASKLRTSDPPDPT